MHIYIYIYIFIYIYIYIYIYNMAISRIMAKSLHSCGSIFNSHRHYGEAIPTKCHVSTIITSITLISFSILAKIPRWKEGFGKISTTFINNFSS